MQEVPLTSLYCINCHYHYALTKSHFWITLLHALFCTSISRFTICEIYLMSKLMSNALSTCSNVWSGQKRRYYTSCFFSPCFTNYWFIDATTYCTTKLQVENRVDEQVIRMNCRTVHIHWWIGCKWANSR